MRNRTRKYPSEIKRAQRYETPPGQLGKFSVFDKKTKTLEVDIPLLIEHFGFPDTEENREFALQSFREAMTKVLPQARQAVVRREDN